MRALEIAIKDVKTVARDYKALALIIAMPLILIVILGAALSPMFTPGDRIAAFNVALVDPGSGELGVYLRETFTSSEIEDLINLVHVPTADDARNAVLEREAACAVILPQVLAGQSGSETLEIAVLGDPADSVRPEIVRGIVDAFASQYSAVYAATGSVIEAMAAAASQAQVALGRDTMANLASQVAGRVTEQTLASRTVLAQSAVEATWISSLQYYTAGMSTMFVLYGGMLGVKSIIEERKTKTMMRLFATRATKADILLGKTLATFLICLLQMLVLIGFTWGVLKVDWGGPLAAVLGMAVTLSFAATGFAMLIGALAKTERMADALENVGVQVMAFLGGCQTPIYVFPAILHAMSKLTLTRWGLQGFLALMEGQGLAGVLQPMFVLITMGAAFLAVGLFRMRLE
jgi:ABC-2 type transport system permease protein